MEATTDRELDVEYRVMELLELTNEELTKIITDAKNILKQRKIDVKQAEVQVALDMLEETNKLGEPTYTMTDVSKFTKISVGRIKKAQVKEVKNEVK